MPPTPPPVSSGERRSGKPDTSREQGLALILAGTLIAWWLLAYFFPLVALIGATIMSAAIVGLMFVSSRPSHPGQ